MTKVLPSRRRQLERGLQKLGLPNGLPINWYQLHLALTHKSADPLHNYEQLELLGDAVLRLAATECLQHNFPDASVGELSALRSVMISDRTLAQLADQFGLETYLIVSPNTQQDVGGRPARLADALEAVVAVLYLTTQDLSLIRPWLDPYFQRIAATVQQDPARQNYKAALQELTQAHSQTLPQYQTQEQRPVDNDPTRYESQVWFRETCWGTGHGPTKKQAEQAAAAVAYPRLKQHLTTGQDLPP
ncbi:MAG: ribonuclease III [Leptolyngbyaceae cyanobacterium SM2_3_12]|nr:ribonuclease III [Leptolyngbyaceae cyanobacterium SM2_3_12]